jgi:hypothetical protein
MVPKFARWLGLSGLLPLIFVVLALIGDLDPGLRQSALWLGLSYGALILSFLGGLWWGLAAASSRPVPGWLWVLAVVPSLYAWVPLALALLGLMQPGAALAVVGAGLWLALLADLALIRRGLAPPWWLALRWPLSLGLGGLSVAAAVLA